MAEVALRAYCEEITELVERSAYDGAIAHCRHILEQYPKCVEAYRLMAQALLEKEEYPQAADLFGRLLSAVPADFVARVGLSIIYDRQGRLPDAVWQMERAFELRPGNSVVQSELRKLYARRDGVEPEKIPLTRGALARMYMHGELYSEATAELRALLAQEPDRVDLQLLLAETLWRYGRQYHYAAQDVALQVLDRLPYCLDANLILSEIWVSSEREDDAELHIKRAQALDPEGTRAQELFGDSSPVEAGEVHVQRLEYAAPGAVSPVQDEVPDWISGLQLGAQAGAAAEEQTMALEPGADAEAVPDWLQGLGASTYDELPEVVSSLVPGGEQAADWWDGMAGGAQEAAEVEGEAPDWLTRLQAGAAAPAEAEALAPSDEMPDWLGAAALGEAPPAEAEAEAEGVPDWLSAMAPAAAAGAVEAGAELEEEVPDWLRAATLEEAEPAEAEFVETEAALPPAEAIPDWLSAMAPAAAAGTVEAEAELEEVPDWLSAAALGEAAPAEAEVEAELEEAPDWLSAAALGEAAPAEAEAEPVEAEAALPSVEAEMPAWMTGEGEMPSMEEAMAWLAQASAGKEDELRAQAEAEADERMAAIMGRKKEEAPPPPPVEVEAEAKLEAEAALPSVEAEAALPSVEAEMPAWMTGEGEMPSMEEAMAWLAQASAGKEDELRAQAEAEADERMAAIMGRKKEEAPAPPPVELKIEAVPKGDVEAEAEAPLPWEAELVEAELAPVEGVSVPELAELELAEVEAPLPWEAELVEAELVEGVSVPELAELELAEVEAPLLWEAELVEAELVEGVSVPELAELELAEVEAPLPWEAELVEAELAPVEGVSVPELAELEAPLPWEAELVEAELAPVEGVSVPELAELELEAVYRALPAAEGEYEGPEPTGSQPGPEWWYQIASDEEEHVEEEAPGEAAPAAAEAPVAQVTEEVAPPAQAPPVKRPPRPAQPARPKVTPQRPSAPVFDLQGIMDRLRADPNDHGALLDLGRGWVQQGNLEGAAEAYGELVKNANLLDDVMDDLEMATESHPGTPALWQLLGDAYMKAGHLQKALKIYRQALKRI